jgi:DNA-binding CsgD family transcriptional regulator
MSAAEVLVGRDAELRALERALEALDGGEPRALGLVGEPGIGKSRLLGELGRRAACRGHVVLAGRASELERDVPFALWVDALDDQVGRHGAALVKGMAADELAELAVALPAIARIAAVAPAAAVERHRVARAVRDLLARLAAARPVTLLLDDVHWADPASADVIALLVHRPPEAGVLLALTARTGRARGLEARLETAMRHRTADVVEVGPIPRDAADALMPGVGSTARARLYAESGGNPFYLEELVRAGPAVHDGTALPGAPGVPRAVMAALAEEIAGLDADARLVAQAGAVAGDPFDPAIAAAAAAVGDDVALAEAAGWAERVPLESGGRRTGIFGALAGHARAAVLLATRRPAEAARVAAAGAAEADAAHAPIWAGRCRSLEGEALAAAGRMGSARERLRGAVADLDALGAFGPRDAALKRLRRVGGRPRPQARVAAARDGGDPRLAPLTPREREVALEVAAGRTNAQIAHRLQLSERTVEKHVSSVLAKLDLRTRAEIVRLMASTTT